MEVSLLVHGESQAIQEPTPEKAYEDLAIHTYGAKTCERPRQSEREGSAR